MDWQEAGLRDSDQPMHQHLAAIHLPKNRVDVWCTPMPQEWDSGLSHAYRAILTSEETERYARFMFEKDRRQFLLTRALARDVLSRYVGVKPSALVFSRNEYGKPALAEPLDCPIVFSLSHTKGLSVCAVASEQSIGVDVEWLQRMSGHPDIAKRFFAPSEVAFLERFNGDQKRSEFLRLWTLKEAFVKARGLGLSIPLSSFEIQYSEGRPPYIFFTDRAHGRPEDWQFLQIRLGNSFHVAIALLMPEPKEMTIRFSIVTPLTSGTRSISLEPNRLNEWILEEM